MGSRKAVFLDRDGVLNHVVCHPEFGFLDSPSNPDQFCLFPEVPGALGAIKALGFLLVVVSNQPGIAKGKFTPELLNAITEKMHNELRQGGVPLDGVYYCLHHPDATVAEYRSVCQCRKPRPGLLLQAAAELDIDLPSSYMIGDGLTDVEAGFAAGCRTILIGNHKCDLCTRIEKTGIHPSLITSDLLGAAHFLTECSKR